LFHECAWGKGLKNCQPTGKSMASKVLRNLGETDTSSEDDRSRADLVGKLQEDEMSADEDEMQIDDNKDFHDRGPQESSIAKNNHGRSGGGGTDSCDEETEDEDEMDTSAISVAMHPPPAAAAAAPERLGPLSSSLEYRRQTTTIPTGGQLLVESSDTVLHRPFLLPFGAKPVKDTNGKDLHPKKRIKLCLKLPTMKNAKKKLPTLMKSLKKRSDEADNDQEAVVADSDEDVNAVAVPTSPTHPSSSTTGNKPKLFRKALPLRRASTGAIASAKSSRRHFQPSKPVRFPPVASPGLLLLRSAPPGAAQGQRHAAQAIAAISTSNNNSKYVKPQQVFEHVMANSGYTLQQRTEQPHRGSSVQKTVGDLFDTNVKLNLHQVALVPKKLWKKTKQVGGTEATIPDLLIDSLRKASRKRALVQEMDVDPVTTSSAASRPLRYEPMPFLHMAPVSLTIPFPEEYIQRQLYYVSEVKNRERAIVEWQEEQERLEIEREELENQELRQTVEGNGSNRSSARSLMANSVVIPPIPKPPEPPRVQDLVRPKESSDDRLVADFGVSPYYYLDPDVHDSSTHPIYQPKGKEDLVAHLDKSCFHVTEGRYFGLRSNYVADPHFVGANAPGLAGVTTGGAGGLATSTSSTTTSTSGLTGGGMTMILSASFHSAAAVPANRDTSGSTEKGPVKKHGGSRGPKTPNHENQSSPTPSASKAEGKESPTAGSAATKKKESAKPVEKKKKPPHIPKQTSPEAKPPLIESSKLKVIMEKSEDKELCAMIKDAILRAAVENSRRQRYDKDTFQMPNGGTTRDLARAFATYSGVKSCERCKSNKQGVRFCYGW
jgi:hypothetical protein